MTETRVRLCEETDKCQWESERVVESRGGMKSKKGEELRAKKRKGKHMSDALVFSLLFACSPSMF